MTDDGVLDQAAAEGFELEERASRDKWVRAASVVTTRR
jgi:hypothetical protein